MILPDPDFTWDASSDPCVAGVRPYRRGSFRLEGEEVGNKYVVHNYGHGGAGISMSWGCAQEVRALVEARAPSGSSSDVAILGAGVMGLTAARLLQQAGYRVTIYASAMTNTTSDVAGGQWAPSFVEHGSGSAARSRFGRILRAAYQAHRMMIGKGYGVSERTNYCKVRAHGLQLAADLGVIPAPERLNLPFQTLNTPGWAYRTLLIEPPIFLERLRSELRPQVQFVQRTFSSLAEVVRLTEPIIVNCTGLGSRALLDDRALEPWKGTLVLLKPQPNLGYLYSGGDTYIFPRADCVVVGGSRQAGVNSATCDRALAARILRLAFHTFAGHRLQLFAGRTLHALSPSPWRLSNK